MPGPVPLSVVVITKNEESRLKECLDSVRWVGEILVVDDESTDQTAEIARQYTERVIQRKMDIEGRHRNWAYAQARYDWVLSLDADERITPELRDEIMALLKGQPEFPGYAVPRRNYLGARWIRHGGWYPSAQLKLFRKDRFRYEESEVHPRALMDGACGRLTHDLIHHSYRNLEDFVAKLNRQTTLEARKWVQDGRRMTLAQALWRSVDRFYRAYLSKEGYRDGCLGFIAAVLGGLYQLVSYGKYWQMKQAGKGGASSPETLPLEKPSREGRATLSAVILTKNEAKQIRECLERLRWADEIIVVDGESADGTPEICRSYGAKVVSHRFEGNFGQERNIGNSHATGDWILQLDADDRVTREFQHAALQVLRESGPHAAYRFRRKNCFLGRWMRHGGWYHYSLHFFRRGNARYEGRVHHDLLVDGTVGVLEAPIEHIPFHSLEQFLDRQNRYTSLEALEIVERRGRISDKELNYQIRRKPAKLFWKLYVKKQGFREHFHGLLFSALYSFVHFIKWAKVWELSENKGENACAS